VVPTTNDPIVRVQGSFIVAGNQEILGNQNFADENYNDAITDIAKANAAADDDDYYEGLFPFVRPVNSFGIQEGVVIDWWDEGAPSPADGQGMGIPWNLLPHPTDPSGETSFHENGLVLNEGMSAEKARATIATDNSMIQSIAISDLQGRVLFNASAINSTSQTLDISDLTGGMYIVKAKLEDGIATSRLTVD